MKRFIVLLTFALIAAACSGAETTTGANEPEEEPEVVEEAPEEPTEDAIEPEPEVVEPEEVQSEPEPEEPEPEPEEPEPEPEEPEPALTQDGDAYSIVWSSVQAPFYAAANDASADPFFHIHSDGATDGFFFSLELYTTGYGALWTGELGDVAVGCMEGVPGPNSTGICPWFDPDGPGGAEPFSAFTATGSITINQLDGDGYNITVNEIVFAEGATVTGFEMSG